MAESPTAEGCALSRAVPGPWSCVTLGHWLTFSELQSAVPWHGRVTKQYNKGTWQR